MVREEGSERKEGGKKVVREEDSKGTRSEGRRK